MAQRDAFTNFLNNVQNLTTSTQQANDVVTRLAEGETNLYLIKKQILKVDVEKLGIIKGIKDVGVKIIDQMVKNRKLGISINKQQRYVSDLQNLYNEALNKANKTQSSNDKLLANAYEKQLKSANLQLEMNKVQLSQFRRTIPLLGRMGDVGAKIADTFVKTSKYTSLIYSGLKSIAGTIFKIGAGILASFLIPLTKAFTVFLDMQKTVGNLAADIGLTAKQSGQLLSNFSELTLSAIKFGGSIKDVAQVIQSFSENTNRNRIFNEREIEQIIELGLGTNLGVQGATELVSSFDDIGLSLEKTIKSTEKARNLSAKMNLNTGKVLNSFKGLVNGLSGIGFTKGLEGLVKLAAKANSIKFDIVKSTDSFTDSFFDLEKAVEVSARMQVLGGRFAKNFGDPMQLAFESMNSPEKLAEKVMDTVKGSIIKSGGQFIIPPQEREMLRIMAEQTGQDYKELLSTSIEQAKVADKMMSLGKSGINLTSFSEEDRLALSNLITLNKNDKYEIKMSDGTTKLLSNITDKSQLKAMLDDKKKNDQAAIQRLNMMERIRNVFDRFFVGLSKGFAKIFGDGAGFEQLLQKFENVGEKISNFIVKDVFGSDGFVTTFKDIFSKASSTFDEIQNIFTGKGTIGSKLKESFLIMFEKIAKPVVLTMLNFMKAGWGALLSSLGNIPIIGKSLKNSGNLMQQEALSNDKTGILGKLYGDETKSNLKNTPSSESRSLSDGLLKSAKVGSKLVGSGGKAAMGLGGKLIGGVGAKVGSQSMAKIGTKFAAKGLAKRIPILGSIMSAGLAIKDFQEGDITGGLLQSASGLAGLLDLVAPGLGTVTSLAIDGIDAGREMGHFDDGVIYKNGSYAKFSKGDMVQFIDQAAMERAGRSNNTNQPINGTIDITGVVTIKSDDGKVVTWDQLYNARDLIGQRMLSLQESVKNGFGNYQNPNTAPIKPLV